MIKGKLVEKFLFFFPVHFRMKVNVIFNTVRAVDHNDTRPIRAFEYTFQLHVHLRPLFLNLLFFHFDE